MVQEIIEAQELIRFVRAHFKKYGDFSLNFEVVCWVKAPDHKPYKDIQQNIRLALFQPKPCSSVGNLRPKHDMV